MNIAPVRVRRKRNAPPSSQSPQWLAFGIEERYDNDLIVGEFPWDDAVVVETGDDLLAQATNRRLCVGAALLKALANGIEEPAVVVLVEFSRPPAALMRPIEVWSCVAESKTQSRSIPWRSTSNCLDFLGHAFLELEDIGVKKHFTIRLAGRIGVGDDHHGRPSQVQRRLGRLR